MNIRFCGAAGTTTGSQHLLEVNGQRILLDCGLFQGRRDESFERNRNFLFEPKTVDAMVLSHAHIDHSGNLPMLTKQGYRGNVYSTFATRDLCSIMLPDSAKIQAYDVEYANKKRKKKKLPLLEPTYTKEDAELCLRQFVNIGYERSLPIADGVTLTFFDAGHILGSAQVCLDVEDRETGKHRRLLFSGDVGRNDNTLLRDPVAVPDVDLLIMESTYGGREHDQDTHAEDDVMRILRRAMKKRGKIVIPAFAVGRTQQMLYVLNRLLEEDKIKHFPIYVDSPLAVSATEIFRLHPECFNDEVYNFLFETKNPFGFEELRLIRSVKESKELNASEEPAIIISASGMCEAGRILHHLKNTLGDEKNTVLFIGYCAQNTLGWKIRNGDEVVNIFGEPHDVRANVEILDSFSGHADHSELLEYYDRMTGSVADTWLVHGETTHRAALAQALRAKHKGRNFHEPELGERVEIG